MVFVQANNTLNPDVRGNTMANPRELLHSAVERGRVTYDAQGRQSPVAMDLSWDDLHAAGKVRCSPAPGVFMYAHFLRL
jgi:hypothetical protein